MYRTFLLICGVYYLVMGGFGALFSATAVLNTLTFDVHPASVRLLSFASGFIGLLIIACSTIGEARPRKFVCAALIAGHLWNLWAHVANYSQGYEANLAVTTLIDLVIVVAAIIVITRVTRPPPATSPTNAHSTGPH